ncbi:MAG: endoxylanase [Flavobacteriaceae bacterium]|nr:endoxylanase [Flavobacteriaceae bacterium]
MKKFNVIRIEKGELIISGYGDQLIWNKANTISNFISPWNNTKTEKTEFKSLWDGENLFFQFKVIDKLIHIDKTDNSFNSIGNSDRVELFFRKDAKLNPYYCLEIDPTPRIMDFRAFPNRNFEFDWNFSKKDLLVKSSINEEGFIVEGAIGINYLKELDLINEGKVEVGVFRAKYNKNNNLEYKPTWISWVEPKSKTPNFHIPSSFGVFYLLS